MPNPTTILIVEDHQIVQVGLRLIFDSEPGFQILDIIPSGMDAIAAACELKPDVILMDLSLPDIDGIETTQRIRQHLPEQNILMFTSHDSDDKIFASLSAGATGYCIKNVDSATLLYGIKAVATGCAWFDPYIAKKVLGATRTPVKTPSGTNSSGFKFGLSKRELEVLALVVDGMSNQQIADKLILSADTVKTHMRHIMEKLLVSDRTQAAVKAMKENLLSV